MWVNHGFHLVRSATTSIFLLCVLSWPAYAQSPLTPGNVVLEDTISIDVLGRYLYAFDSLSGGRNQLELDLREKVIFQGSRGRVGLVVTNRRLLAIAAGTGGWRTLSLQLAEQGHTNQWISSRLALVVTPKRIIGFDAGAAAWLEVGIGPLEAVQEARLASSTAVVLTRKNAYGMSPDAGGFFATPLLIHEEIESVTANANIGRVLTSQRLLIFKASTGTWTDTERPLN